jgi:hypothetical protein
MDTPSDCSHLALQSMRAKRNGPEKAENQRVVSLRLA